MATTYNIYAVIPPADVDLRDTLTKVKPNLINFTYNGYYTDEKGRAQYGNIAFKNERYDGEAVVKGGTAKLQDIDFVKYHVFPEGYMVRTSAENNREQVRISKKAKQAGIRFERVGCDYIAQYKRDPNIRAVKLVFLTDPAVDYKKLAADAKTVHDITLTLSRILEGMPTDCNSCNLKPICDEVEGMKELHFGQNKAEFRS